MAATKKLTAKKVTTEKEPEAVAQDPVVKVTPDIVQPPQAQPANVVEPSPPAESVSPEVSATEQQPSLDPLTDFKEKMSEEEQVPPYAPTKKNFMWPILLVVFLALALLGGVFIYKQGMNKGTQVNVVSLSPTPTVTSIPTVATADLAKYEIEILNGSEVDGEAGRQKSNLEEKGFIISSVGNAQNSDYTKTIIQTKEKVEKGFLDKLKSVLEESFVVGETEELPEDADSDVIVILGSKTN